VSKKLTIEVVFGSGKTSIRKYTTRKGVDAEYSRLAKATKIYDGNKYTDDFVFRKK